MNPDELNGKPIDVHAHIFPDHVAPGAMKFLTEQCPDIPCYSDGTRAGLIERMDEAGVGRAVAAMVATKPSQSASIFAFCEELLADPRIIPFPSIHPAADDAREWVDRAAGRFRGLKFHALYQDFTLDDPAFVDLARAARDAGLVMLMHAGLDPAYPGDTRAEPEAMARLLDALGGAKVIAAHLGAWRQWEASLEILAGRPDLWLDTCSSLGQAPPELARAIIETHGAARVLFGTDSPWEDMTAEVGYARNLGLGEPATRRILWENAEALLGLAEQG